MRLADNIDLQAGRQAAHNPFCHMFVVSAFTQHTTVWILLFPFIFIKKIAVFLGGFLPGGEVGSSTKISCGKRNISLGKIEVMSTL